MEEKIVIVLNEMSEYLSITQMKKLQEVIIKTFADNEASGDMMNTLISEAMKNPEIKRQFNQGVTDGLKKHR